MWRAFAISFAAGFGGAVAVVGTIWLTGSSFGQRCERMYPDQAKQIDLCIENLTHGYRP